MEGWEVFTGNWGARIEGVGFIMGWWEIFKVSLYIWLRGANLPILSRPPILPLSLFFKFCPIPSTFLSLPFPTPTVLSIVLFLWLNGWSRCIGCAILLNDNMDLHILSLGTLVPEGPWCVFYIARHHVCWGLTHNVVFRGTLIWYHTHTNTHSRLTHPYKYIKYLHYLLCGHNSYLYYIKWLNE